MRFQKLSGDFKENRTFSNLSTHRVSVDDHWQDLHPFSAILEEPHPVAQAPPDGQQSYILLAERVLFAA